MPPGQRCAAPAVAGRLGPDPGSPAPTRAECQCLRCAGPVLSVTACAATPRPPQPLFLPGQVIKEQKYTKASDVYAFGLIMWEASLGPRDCGFRVQGAGAQEPGWRGQAGSCEEPGMALQGGSPPTLCVPLPGRSFLALRPRCPLPVLPHPLQLLTWELPFVELSNFQASGQPAHALGRRSCGAALATRLARCALAPAWPGCTCVPTACRVCAGARLDPLAAPDAAVQIMMAVTQQGKRPPLKDHWGAAQVCRPPGLVRHTSLLLRASWPAITRSCCAAALPPLGFLGRPACIPPRPCLSHAPVTP